jgi:hypothetical protein
MPDFPASSIDEPLPLKEPQKLVEWAAERARPVSDFRAHLGLAGKQDCTKFKVLARMVRRLVLHAGKAKEKTRHALSATSVAWNQDKLRRRQDVSILFVARSFFLFDSKHLDLKRVRCVLCFFSFCFCTEAPLTPGAGPRAGTGPRARGRFVARALWPGQGQGHNPASGPKPRLGFGTYAGSKVR